jgi:hypothetical protein
LATKINQPTLPELIRRFLFDQLVDDDTLSADIPLSGCPLFQGRISVFYSATSYFYAPNEQSGMGGMHRQVIRSNPRWRKSYCRYDTVLIQVGNEDEVLSGMQVGRILALLQFQHRDVTYPCAFVEWFVPDGDAPDDATKMWIIKGEETLDMRRNVGLVHIDTIVRPVHLIAVYGNMRIPVNFHFSYSLDVFDRFYLNHYSDYNVHELIK